MYTKKAPLGLMAATLGGTNIIISKTQQTLEKKPTRITITSELYKHKKKNFAGTEQENRKKKGKTRFKARQWYTILLFLVASDPTCRRPALPTPLPKLSFLDLFFSPVNTRFVFTRLQRYI